MIAEIIESLRNAQGAGAGVMSRRVRPDAHVDIFAAVRKPQNTPMLFFEASTSAMPLDFVIPDASGFDVVTEPVEPGPHGRVRIQLELLDPLGEPVFLALIDDVVARAAGAASESQALALISAAIVRWHRFFRQQGAQGLSREQQQGLFGELFFLRERLAKLAGMESAVASWTGPSAANQDFEFFGHGFEVKTTSNNPITLVRISNLRQLDDAVLATLHLVVVEVERHEHAEKTLPEAVEETRAAVLSEAPHMEFALADRLLEYGYLDQDAQRYAGTGYGVRGVRVFRVGEGFPRLTEDDVPDGVGDVKYSIALPALQDYEVAPADFATAIGDWVNELG